MAQDKCITVGIKIIKNVLISVVITTVIAEGQESMEGVCWCGKKRKKKGKQEQGGPSLLLRMDSLFH